MPVNMKRQITIRQIIIFNVICLLGACILSHIALLINRMAGDPEVALHCIEQTTNISNVRDLISGQLYAEQSTREFMWKASLFPVTFAVANILLLVMFARQQKKERGVAQQENG